MQCSAQAGVANQVGWGMQNARGATAGHQAAQASAQVLCHARRRLLLHAYSCGLQPAPTSTAWPTAKLLPAGAALDGPAPSPASARLRLPPPPPPCPPPRPPPPRRRSVPSPPSSPSPGSTPCAQWKQRELEQQQEELGRAAVPALRRHNLCASRPLLAACAARAQPGAASNCKWSGVYATLAFHCVAAKWSSS